MQHTSHAIILVAMILLTIVSMGTTYISLTDSILPEPVINIPFTPNTVWECSIFALALSVAIGLMLFALKLSIVDGHKKLNIFGLLGMFIIAFISIAFNMDVLYRTADKEFFIRYSNSKMRSVYETYLAEAESTLTEKRTEIRRELAKQQGELEAEIEGLRADPEGYGRKAKEEDYRLTLLEKTTAVDIEAIDEALKITTEADEMLRSASSATLQDIENTQQQLRVVIKDVGARAGIPLPEPVRLENPLFAVFEKLFDFRTAGWKEFFVLIIAILLDLGDIVGYAMVPNKPKKAQKLDLALVPDLPGPEIVEKPDFDLLEGPRENVPLALSQRPEDEPALPAGETGTQPSRTPRAIHLHRR